MSTDVNNGARKRADVSDLETSVSDVDSEKLIVSSTEEDDDTDESGTWKYRPPPRGFTVEESYVLCPNIVDGVCSFGENCVDAHSDGELNEWKERFEIRKNEENSSNRNGDKTYTEKLLETLHQSNDPGRMLLEKLPEVEVTCSNETTLSVSSKACKREWIFVLKTNKLLKGVLFLQDEHRLHFSIKHVYPQHPNKQITESCTKKSSSVQEWVAKYDEKGLDDTSSGKTMSHRVKVHFSTDIYGTFRQTICFEFFGVESRLVKNIFIDVMPLEEFGKIQDMKNDIVSLTKTRWSATNSELLLYEPPKVAGIDNSADQSDKEKERELMEKYPLPRAETFVLPQNIIREKLSEKNYQEWMNTMLYVEEMARFDLIAKFNLKTALKISNNYIIAPNSLATSTAKYSHSGELFGILKLAQDISEDTSEGSLILNNCNSLFFVIDEETSDEADKKLAVFEALIEDKSKNVIYLKLSAETVARLELKNNDELKVNVQFQPNRLTYCEWHLAVDRNKSNYSTLFPDTSKNIDIPWNPNMQFDTSLDPRLNSKQKEAVISITTPTTNTYPPFLLIGPFGTGKTFTLAQIIKRLLKQEDSKILICTHSNSAADLYIREYLHPWVESGIPEAKPLRIYYHKRWPSTVNQIVQKYCLIETKGNTRFFMRPTVEDIMRHRIIVVTLSTSMEICSLNIKKGTFTHILLDEAAQSLECESITPLALADENTRIVLAGDHMQMTPEVYSNFAKEKNFQISLLERLYTHYSENYQTKILLCENYRAHDDIIKFTSDLFYDQKLIASGKQPSHPKFHPLTFFTARGEDVQDVNSTAYYNNAEVYEIVERVGELKRRWPTAWGKFNDTSIGILTPYADQVFRIRSELRKKKLAGISVERILNVQGKQFRAVFLSTVRTRLTTCSNKREDADYGFLSNTKLLNTAITRAQSLVSVVGDPIALCSVGRCRKIWEKFIETCYRNKSLYGISWSTLKSQLDNVEMRKVYVLNPLAPEFIPRQYNTEAYLREQIMKVQRNNLMYMSHHPNNFNQNFMMNRQNLRSPMQPMASRPMINPYKHQHDMLNAAMQISQPFPGAGPPIPPVVPAGFQGNFHGPHSFNRAPSINGNFWMNKPMAPQPPNIPSTAPNPLGQNSTFNPYFNGGFKNGMSTSPWSYTPQPPPQHPPMVANLRPHLRHPLNQIYPNPQTTTPQQMMPFFNQQQSQMPQNQFIQPSFPSALHMQQPKIVPQNDFVNLPRHMMTNNSISQENNLKMEKDFHFLQNVHFPEPNNVFTGDDKRTAFPLNINNFLHLLPPNMSFHDVINQTREFQWHWFRKLIEKFGLEEANKFVELLKRYSQKNSSSLPAGSNINPSLSLRSNIDEKSIINNGNRAQTMAEVVQFPQQSMLQQQKALPMSSNNKVASTHQSQNNNEKAELSLLASLTKEFEQETPKDNVFYSNFSENNILGGIDLFNEVKPSIPLYLRTRNQQ